MSVAKLTMTPTELLPCSQGGGGHHSGDSHSLPVSPVLLEAIKQAHRQRENFLRAAMALNNQIKAIERRTGGAIGPEAFVIAEIAVHRDGLIERSKVDEKSLRSLARELPVWQWVAQMRGISDLGLGRIVAESRDLSLYDNPAKVWKRFGLYPGAKATKGETLGFSPRRRSVAIQMAEGFIKQGDYYRDVYLDRKLYEAAQYPDLTKAHIHHRARRYMAKRFLKDLWREWNRGHTYCVNQESFAPSTLAEEGR